MCVIPNNVLNTLKYTLYIAQYSNSDFMLQIILLHTILYSYDVHDTILLKHIHFGSILVMRWRFYIFYKCYIIHRNYTHYTYSEHFIIIA